MTTIVFSKDRALQLDAFLRSYWHHVRPVAPVCVLVLATTPRHARAYKEVFAGHPWATLVAQGRSFKDDILSLLPDDGCVTFFVDDQIFLRRWNVIDKPGLSLRLGLNLTYDYNSSDALQPLPPFRVDDDGFVTWIWCDGALSWGYPLALDGHVYDALEVTEMVDSLAFRSPNTLESQLQVYASRFLPRQGFCHFESLVVNVPWTLVQTDWHNRNAGLGADALLEYWEQGYRVDTSMFYGLYNRSVHQEFPLALEKRLLKVVAR